MWRDRHMFEAVQIDYKKEQIGWSYIPFTDDKVQYIYYPSRCTFGLVNNRRGIFIYDSGSVYVIVSGIPSRFMYTIVVYNLRHLRPSPQVHIMYHTECHGRGVFRMHQACHEPRTRVAHRISKAVG